MTLSPEATEALDLSRFARKRLGLRFVDNEVEANYRAWHHREFRRTVVLGMNGSLLAWVLTLFGFLTLGLDLFMQVVVVIVPIEFPILFVTRYAAQKGRPEWLILWGSVVGNIGAGFLSAWIPYHGILPSPAAAVGGAVVVLFFASTIFRFRLRIVASVTAFNGALHVGMLTASHQAGVVTRLDWVSGIVLILAAVGTGILVSYVNDRGSRSAFVQEQIIAAQGETIVAEKARADALLAAILPESIAETLKEKPGHIAEHFDEVTIVFSDIVGFTPLSESMPPNELIELLNDIVGRFDALAETIGIEKIKTIGDAYMAVAGLPQPVADHPHRAADFALGMLECLADVNRERGTNLELRIGVFTGPVVAGVIGTQKFAYDLWGDAVNTAARMESHGVPGAIQVGETTWTLIQDTHVLTERGTVNIKGKGEMKTWLLESRGD